MGCLTIGELYLAQIDGLVLIAGTTVTYYPVILEGYATATQTRTPSESSAVSVAGVFGEEKVTAPDNAISYVTTFTLSSGAYIGTPSPGDRIVSNSQSYRVTEVRRAWVGSLLANYTLMLEQ
jgi:hypothetical protein